MGKDNFSSKHYAQCAINRILNPKRKSWQDAIILEVIKEDYVRTAKSKGLSKGTIINRHVLKNALIPVITISGLQFGNLLSGAIAVEVALSIPGLGALLAQGLADRDWMIIQNLVLIFAFLFIVINLIVDIIYSLVDPRIRYD